MSGDFSSFIPKPSLCLATEHPRLSAGYYILVAELEIEARSDRKFNSSPILNEAGAEPEA